MKFITRCGDSGRTMGVWGGRGEGRAPWPWLGAGMGAGGVEPRLQPTRGGCQDPARDPQGSQGAPRAWPGWQTCGPGAAWRAPREAFLRRCGCGGECGPPESGGGPGSAPPHPAPHPLLSPLSSPGTGEEWATACAP